MFRTLLSVYLIFSAPTAWADHLFVMELFTSQGCSSCPPADEMLTEYASRDDVIALSYHVDYWDYMGWEDTLGQRAFSDRQKNYATVAGQSMVYTPQMILNGVHHVRGYQPAEVAAFYDDAPAPEVHLEVTQVDGGYVLSSPEAPHLGRMTVQLVRYIPQTVVHVRAGENEGREMLYTNSVVSLEELRRWDGDEPLDIRVPADSDFELVVLIQATGFGPIFGAVLLP